ncbi:MAG: type I-E CRISPR-associated protein Cas5/CasD [Nitrospirae bacterium]|nr:type I-E CRISPR-associated protein Cas5/CasD [Nitrospirota bacterium]
MSQPYTLLMRLEGPMQSWGYRSRFDYRDTALEPTRSGVIGMICAAMGIARGEDISRFDAMRMGVRVDKEGRPERDYHTAMNVIKADGSGGNDTVVSYRDYLADASFTVGLQSENTDLLCEIAEALRNPVWTLFLGRKAFPLVVPPLNFDDCPKAGTLEEHLFSGHSDKRIVIETPDGERTQHDWPLCFRERRFKPRTIQTRFGGKTT